MHLWPSVVLKVMGMEEAVLLVHGLACALQAWAEAASCAWSSCTWSCRRGGPSRRCCGRCSSSSSSWAAGAPQATESGPAAAAGCALPDPTASCRAAPSPSARERAATPIGRVGHPCHPQPWLAGAVRTPPARALAGPAGRGEDAGGGV